MATTPDDPYEGRTHTGDDARRILEQMRPVVTKRRPLPVMAFVLLVVAGYCMSAAPWPLNLVGLLTLLAVTFVI